MNRAASEIAGLRDDNGFVQILQSRADLARSRIKSAQRRVRTVNVIASHNGFLIFQAHCQTDAHHFVGRFAQRRINHFSGDGSNEIGRENRIFYYLHAIRLGDLALVVANRDCHRNRVGPHANRAANGVVGVLLNRSHCAHRRRQFERRVVRGKNVVHINTCHRHRDRADSQHRMTECEYSIAQTIGNCAHAGHVHVARNQLRTNRAAAYKRRINVALLRRWPENLHVKTAARGRNRRRFQTVRRQ